MASYKSAIRSTTTNGQSEPKLKDKAQQLQECFPSWSHEDLQSILAEVNGDVELAASRISDGKAEQWGSVSRKKDKKGGNTPKDSAHSPRGDFRGGRGGARGNRGGSARGGAVRPRGDFRGGRGGHANGHVPRTSSPAVSQHVDDKGGDALKASLNVASEATPSTSQTPASWTEAAKPEESSASSAWGGSSAWGNTDADPDNALPAHVNGSTSGTSIQVASPLSAKLISKSPATSKLSWAQIARPQEKPAAPPAPVVQHPSPRPPVTAIHPPAPLESTTVNHLTSASTSVPAPSEAEPTVSTGWEDPTTVENPSFDEEPSAPAAAPEPVKEPEQKSEPETVPALGEITASKPPEITVHEQAAAPSAPPTPAPSTPSKVATRPAPISQRNSARHSNYAKIASDQGGVVMPPTPSSIGANLSGISSFGSFGELKSAGVEKVGMQFGSLSLGGTSEPEPEPEVETVEASSTPAAQASMSAPESISVAPPPSTSLNSGLYQSQSQPIQTSLSQPTVSSSVATSISNSPAQSFQQVPPSSQPLPQTPSLSQLPQQLQQQAAQTQSQNLPSHHHYSQLGLPTHIDQSSQAQVQAQSSPQHVQQQQSYLRQNEQSPYGNNVSAGVGSGFHHSPTPPMQDNNGYGAFGSALSSQSLGGQGLGQGLSGMGQGTLGGMGGLGGMSGLGGQGLGHQQQQSLSAFDNYGYEGGQRNFYDSYQPNTFGRGVLGHDDLKGSLPSQQQGQQAPSTVSTGTSTSLPPSVSSQSSVPQSQQSPATSVSSQGQPQLGQGSAPAGYHPAAPLPTYYYQPFPPQNSYYGAAPSTYGYGVGGMGVPQPYHGLGKYPTIYPVPPGSAPSPAGKPSPGGMGVHGPGGVISHSGIGVQPQSYGGGLYGQQQGYDDYQQHTQQQQQHHQQQGHQHHNSHGLGLGQDYSKQLYGGQGALQGYMSGAGSGVSAGVVSGSGAGPRSGASPETAYKPYAPKDVGVGRGNVPQSQGQGQAQSQGQGQGQGGQGGPQGQGFYGGNRFGSGSSVGAGVGAPQQSAHGAPLYPQGQNDAGYYYQQRQYWQ